MDDYEGRFIRLRQRDRHFGDMTDEDELDASDRFVRRRFRDIRFGDMTDDDSFDASDTP